MPWKIHTSPLPSCRCSRFFLPRISEVSKRFYAELGFTVKALEAASPLIRVGAHAFLLQKFRRRQRPGTWSCIFRHLDGWWRYIAALDLATRYKVESPRAPARALGSHPPMC